MYEEVSMRMEAVEVARPPVCSSCNRLVVPKGKEVGVSFKCPNCGEVVIWRCPSCRKQSKPYKCPKCGFEGP